MYWKHGSEAVPHVARLDQLDAEGLPLGLLSQRVTYALDSFPLVAVPLFIFVGNLVNPSGITDRIFRFAYTLVGRLGVSPKSTSSAA
ncbi:TRAP transporter large permease subunit [Ensifer aridi]|uniref:TRAP transporter large permease subunit n=1 Tax=Ensifer aridi TaxID=1708715 RepID=UPI001FCDF0FD|nr:TRAP transporter large permease subunit [Ensifer aridi]